MTSSEHVPADTDSTGQTLVAPAPIGTGPNWGPKDSTSGDAKGGLGARLRHVSAQYGVLLALLVMIAGFSIGLPDTFPTWSNLTTILSDQSIIAIVALAAMIPLTAGEFDLSIGNVVGFTSVIAAYLASRGTPVLVVLVACLAIGLVVGIINATLVRLGVDAFIATLGVGTILGGGNLLVTQGTPIFEGIGRSFTKFAKTEVLDLRVTFFYFLAVAALLYYLFEWTPVGRYLRATGKGYEAARLTGVRTEMWMSLSFIASAVLCSFAGFLQTATVASAPPTVGPEFVLPAFAAAFLGTTTIMRGFFNVLGTIVGVLLLAVGTTGLALAGAPFWVQPVFNGTALVLAVLSAVLVGRRRKAARG